MPAPGGKHFEQAYNAQAAVDSANQIIVAAEVTEQPSDKRQAKPMIDRVRDNTGKLPRQMSADAGYFSAEVVQVLTSDGVDVYMPPDKTPHGFKLPPGTSGPDTKRAFPTGPDAAQAEDKEGTPVLWSAQGAVGASSRPDQAGKGIPAVFAERQRESRQ